MSLKPEQIERFLKRLEQELADLVRSTESHRQSLDESHVTQDFIGADRAAELENLEVDSSVLESEENLAKKIEHALERISAGSYGQCEGCGAGIALARLEAKPSVSLCIDCQEEHEST